MDLFCVWWSDGYELKELRGIFGTEEKAIAYLVKEANVDWACSTCGKSEWSWDPTLAFGRNRFKCLSCGTVIECGNWIEERKLDSEN